MRYVREADKLTSRTKRREKAAQKQLQAININKKKKGFRQVNEASPSLSLASPPHCYGQVFSGLHVSRVEFDGLAELGDAFV